MTDMSQKTKSIEFYKNRAINDSPSDTRTRASQLRFPRISYFALLAATTVAVLRERAACCCLL